MELEELFGRPKLAKKNSKNLVEAVLNRIFYGGNGFSTIKNF